MNEATGRACPDHSTDSTAWITIVDCPGGRLDVFDELDSTHQDDLHVGVLSRYCCQQPDALRIVAIWESQAAAGRDTR